MRKIKGSVTLFVAMIFLLVITVIMTVITSARIQGAGIMVSTSVSCSLDSVFAGYDNELFDKFGVLLFKGEDKETVISQLNGYLKDNIENTTGLDLYEIELKGIELESLTNITEYGGLLWFEEAVEYEKYAKVINMAADYLNIEDSEEQTEAIQKTLDEMEQISDMSEYIDGRLQEMIALVYGYEINNGRVSINDFKDNYIIQLALKDKIYNDKYRMFCNKFFYMDEQLKKIKRYMADNQYDKAENLKLDFENKLSSIISTIKRLETLLGIVGDCCTEIETRADNVKQYVTEAKDLLGDEITESFCTEMDSLKNYREILKENVCDILTFEKTLETDKAILIEMGSLVRNMSDETDYKYLMELSEGYDCDGLAINIDNFIQRKKGNNLFKSLKKLFSQGILGLVLPEGDTISGRHISQTKLPSTYIIGSDKDYYKHDNNTTTLAKDIIYGEYVMDNFNSYTDKKEGTVLNYEVEYIINGEQYDAANLYEIVKKIAAIRSVGNFACIMTDHEKRKQAEELAEITFGWTNVRPLIATMKYVYLYMWSYAEGLADVKALLSGYKTGLIKTKDKWQVSYTDFLTLNLEIDEDAYKSGLSYEMYLRALLMLKDKTIKSSRTMDLVELWEKANGNKDFSIRNYIYGISGKILYTVKGLNKEYIYSFGQTY